MRIISFLIACGAAFEWLLSPVLGFMMDLTVFADLCIGVSMALMAVFSLCFEDRLETRLVTLSAWLLVAGYLLYVLKAVSQGLANGFDTVAVYSMTILFGGILAIAYAVFALSQGKGQPGRLKVVTMVGLITALCGTFVMDMPWMVYNPIAKLFYMGLPSVSFFLFAWVRAGILAGSERVTASGDEKRLKKDLAWVEKQLLRLKDTFDEDELTQEEYDEERKALLEKL